MEKSFLLTGLDSEEQLRFNVKCDPDKAIELREEFSCVLPGYHMNKKHWNTIVVDGSVSSKQLKEWIDHSYELVAGKSSKSTACPKNNILLILLQLSIFSISIFVLTHPTHSIQTSRRRHHHFYCNEWTGDTIQCH